MELGVNVNTFTGVDSAPVSQEDVEDNLGCYAAFGLSKFIYDGGFGVVFYGITWKRIKGEWRLGRVEKVGNYFTPKADKEDRGPQTIELYETRWNGENREVMTRQFTGRDGDEHTADQKASLSNQAKITAEYAHDRTLRAVMKAIMVEIAKEDSLLKADVERIMEEKRARKAARASVAKVTAPSTASAVKRGRKVSK